MNILTGLISNPEFVATQKLVIFHQQQRDIRIGLTSIHVEIFCTSHAQP